MGWGIYLSHLDIRAKEGGGGSLVHEVWLISESPGQSKRGACWWGGAACESQKNLYVWLIARKRAFYNVH